MKTFTVAEDQKRKAKYMFSIKNAYISLGAITSILASVPDVDQLRRRKLFTAWDSVHISFKYRGRACVVMEPFGDNSLYWIGLCDTEVEKIDIAEIEECFRRYQPPLYRKILGDILLFRIFGCWFCSSEKKKDYNGNSSAEVP
jgi:hypothetical protein